MISWRSVGEFCAAVRARAASGRLADALFMIVEFIGEVITYESSFGVVFSSRELDELTQELGRQDWSLAAGSPDPEQTVYLVTGLYPTGGHSRVLLDLIEADVGTKATILVSNTYHDVPAGEVQSMFDFKGAAVEVAPVGDLAERLRWMEERLAALRPARTYLFTHHYDPVCVGAAQPELTGQLIYYHHCDHTLALGVHLPHAIHVDFNAKGFNRCRQVEGIQTNAYWPLTVQAPRHRADRPFLRSGRLTTCTCGGPEKFDNTRLWERLTYAHDYFRIVPQILNATGGTHIHIGALSEGMLATIRNGLKDLGLPEDRFVYVPYAPSLSDTLITHEVDIYVGSFPLGGGRAVVEVMGTGLPMILHSNYRSVFFTDTGEAYPGVLAWRDPEELIAQLAALDPVILAEHARRSRAHYEQRHAPALLSQALRATLDGARPPPPPAMPYRSDPLQAWLDLRNANSPEREALEAQRQALEARCEALEAQREALTARLADVELRLGTAEARVVAQEQEITRLGGDVIYMIGKRTEERESVVWPLFVFLEKQTRGWSRRRRARRQLAAPASS